MAGLKNTAKRLWNLSTLRGYQTNTEKRQEKEGIVPTPYRHSDRESGSHGTGPLEPQQGQNDKEDTDYVMAPEDVERENRDRIEKPKSGGTHALRWRFSEQAKKEKSNSDVEDQVRELEKE